MNDLVLFLQLAVQLGTPLLFATLGGILNDKVGNLNLGIEGMMMVGACAGFGVAYHTSSPLLSIVTAGVASLLLSLLYALVTVTFKGNQTVTGFAITILGTGIANFSGESLSGLTLSPSFIRIMGIQIIPVLINIPILGTVLFSQSYLFHLSLWLAFGLYFYLKKTNYGLIMRMVGENPAAADTSGINTTSYKYIHIALGGLLCGLGGAFLSLVFVPRWQDNIVAGMGWIAVALVIFSTWNPIKAIFGSYLFGLLRALSIKYQNISFRIGNNDISITSQIIDMLPYLLTIVILVLTTLSKKRENQAPAWLGKSYFREDR
ncbi:MAG TPA: ABC transporter permease [Bacillota bacterium]|nr:ABC transporter permease [Bacillota bacterium]